jgi:hypothetical protein
MDMGYDNNAVYEVCAERNVAPAIPPRQTPDVKRGKDKPPRCESGEWRFAGAGYGRKATKWRCPTGECEPASKRHGAAEREFGRLKNEWALMALRVRRIGRFGYMPT